MSLKSVNQYAKELKLDYPKLTEFEALNLAIGMQRNEIFRVGLNVSSDDSYPSALEALAIALGFHSSGSGNVIDALKEIANNIESK
ncbi:hypothetical protein B0F87_10419 [Methylobacter tundripaludum]|uniref:Uncharacterized protein n=1 Tax=Methylobacter tundripaludum TaxID=173365 RepID=A0A2S6HEP3_9GAMM|nr:histidine kinase [Methylobacter tundripaludum]PPK75932.1 hypothetical protein B0F87_10419 [Methylobacter tundripaludum]